MVLTHALDLGLAEVRTHRLICCRPVAETFSCIN
jgi:hypothetical protein